MQFTDVWHCFQHYWPIAFYCVSGTRTLSHAQINFKLRHRSVLFYSLPNGGAAAMVWGVRRISMCAAVEKLTL